MNKTETGDVSRRRFLKQTAFGVIALSTTNVIPGSMDDSEVPPGIEQQLGFFSPKEYLVMKAVSDCMVGPVGEGVGSASQIDAALRADKFLQGADPEIQEQFHQLLTVFNAPVFTFLFDFRFSSFIKMNPQDQDSYLEDWMTSVLGFRRTGFQALKRTALSMYYTDEQSWKAIGFEGMEVQKN